MKTAMMMLLNFCLLGLMITGCQRSSGEVWEDSKTAKRYMGRGMRSMAGKQSDSRQVCSRDEFGLNSNNYSTAESDFIPMDGDRELAMGDRQSLSQSHLTPGEGNVPGIEAFRDPSQDPELSRIFQNVLFDYNSNLVKGQDNIDIVKKIAAYLKQHPNTYIFVEGHCDERGPQAYNFALGTNRSNGVRSLLVQEGVNPENVFTISYGKERPIIQGNGEISWAQNRRAQFRIYDR